MRLSRLLQNAGLGLCLLTLLTATGCDIQTGNWGQANQVRHERTVSDQRALAPGSVLDVDTSSGAVTITGADVTDCNVTATITGYAPTAAEAQGLAEQVEITLEHTGSRLTIRADRPKMTNNRGVSVSYAITVPRRTHVACHSAYGSLKLTHLEGTVNGKTNSGSIQAEAIRGSVELNTSYGSITCRDIAGPEVTLNSASGSVTATDIKGTLRMNSSYGSLACEGFADGDLTLKTSSGRITVSHATFGTCEANSSYGAVTGRHLEGEGITLRSSSGGVELVSSGAATIDLSSSYGPITAQQITTGDLKTRSGSGRIEVVCSESSPADLSADARTSYGSIRFVAPPAFAGQVRLVTHYGKINTDRPVTLSGRISKKEIVGTIGDGTGSLDLETSSGSIDLR